jgi:hypothetical protein
MVQSHLKLNSIYSCRFLQSFEDCWNVLLCTILLVLLTAMCTIAFAAVTVQYSLRSQIISGSSVVNTNSCDFLIFTHVALSTIYLIRPEIRNIVEAIRMFQLLEVTIYNSSIAPTYKSQHRHSQ